LAKKLKKSVYYLDDSDEYTICVCLNLSSYAFDWSKSKLDKEFFIERFYSINNSLLDNYILDIKIYDGTEEYGSLDFMKEIHNRNDEYDAFLCVTAVVHFHETLLATLTESFKNIKNKYTYITPESQRLWDHS
jgi:hypothetical protein